MAKNNRKPQFHNARFCSKPAATSWLFTVYWFAIRKVKENSCAPTVPIALCLTDPKAMFSSLEE